MCTCFDIDVYISETELPDVVYRDGCGCILGFLGLGMYPVKRLVKAL